MSLSGIAWVDGDLVPRAEARVSIDDFGFRYGLTCFETMLARNGRVFRLDAHLDRLEHGLRLFHIVPPPRELLRRAIDQALAANGLVEASVRLSVTPGDGERPVLPAAGEPVVIVTADPLTASHSRDRLWISSVRVDGERPWRSAKVGQFAPYLLARAEAEAEGADDALLLDHAGNIAEASTANVFLVIDGTLITPRLEDGPLPGVTRAAVIEVARARGLRVMEESVSVTRLARASEVFLTSSIAGLVPVRSIAWNVDGAREEWRSHGGSGLHVQLDEAYRELVRQGTD